MNLKDKARLYRELAKLQGASFPMDKSVGMLLGQKPSSSRRRFLEGLEQGFASRLGFAESMRTYNKGQASALELTLVQSGEQAGRLAETFEHLAHYFDTWQKGVTAARSAMVYPLVLMHMGVVVPEFFRHSMMGLMGMETNMGSAILWRILIFWGLLIGISIVWKILSRIAVRSVAVDQLLGLLPLIGSLRKHWALARFCQVFHGGLLASMRISACLRMAGEASQSGVLWKGSECVAENIDRGRSLTESFELSRAFSRPFVTAIATADAAGGLDTEMARWAVIEIESAAQTQKTAAELYPKAMYFCIVAYVGYAIVNAYAPYLKMMGKQIDALK